jgi:hypothetical protein
LFTDHLGARDDHGALDGVAELAHVARPAVLREERECPRLDAAHLPVVVLVRLAEEAQRERLDLVGAVAQRRDGQHHGVHPVVEVVPEGALFAHRLEVAVGRGDDPHVDSDLLAGADAGEALGLEDAQERRLRRERELADLVEEHRAPVGLLEDALLLLARAREGALLVAEERALDELRRDRTAVDAHHRLRPAQATLVDQPRQDLLAGSGLALQDHRDLRLGEAGHHLQDLAHHRSSDDRLLSVGGVALDPPRHRRSLHRVLGRGARGRAP